MTLRFLHAKIFESNKHTQGIYSNGKFTSLEKLEWKKKKKNWVPAKANTCRLSRMERQTLASADRKISKYHAITWTHEVRNPQKSKTKWISHPLIHKEIELFAKKKTQPNKKKPSINTGFKRML